MTIVSTREPQHATVGRLPGVGSLRLPRPGKLHDYTDGISGVEYVFEPIDRLGTRGYMTAHSRGRGVKPGDRLFLKQGRALVQYQVEIVDYYACPADMWTGVLCRLP